MTWRDNLTKDTAGYVTGAAPSPIESCEPAAGKKAFYLETTFNAEDAQPAIAVKDYPGNLADNTRPYAVPGRGIWIEAVKTAASPEYIDFHIRSCWTGIGTGATPQQTNTIIRLAIK